MIAVADTAQTAPTHFVEAGGARIAYRRFGIAAPVPLVLLQRFRGNLDDWDPALVNRLAERRLVVMFNQPGVGGSTGTLSSTVAAMAKDAVAFIEALAFESVDLLGYSLGGFVAQLIAIERPDLVRRLVLAGTAAQGGEGFAPFRQDVSEAAGTDTPGFAELLTIFYAPSPTSKVSAGGYLARIQERTIDRDQSPSLRARDAQLAAIRQWGINDPDERLSSIAQPALVANGDADAMIPTANTHALHARLPQSQLAIYPDAGHGFLYQHPRQFADEVNRFLDDRGVVTP